MKERRKKKYGGEQTSRNNCFFINPEFDGRKTKKIAQKTDFLAYTKLQKMVIVYVIPCILLRKLHVQA